MQYLFSFKFKLIIAIVSVLMSGIPCFSQIQAPTQVDTLYVTSMQYHFDEIRPENWPFTYVLRTPGSFVFNGESFQIIESYSSVGFIKFILQAGKEEVGLEYSKTENGCRIRFSGYVLECEKAQNKTREINAELKAGVPNVSEQISKGKPVTRLEGRTVDKAGLKKPVYKAQSEGCVVVDIWVDQYGKVVKAVPGGAGTTALDKALWTSARNAALETGFNRKSDAPALQQGTITYIFNLK